MMRSPGSLSIVCRRRSGELVVHERAMPTLAQGPRTWPLVRGVVTVVESLKVGSQALKWSANLYEQDLDDEGKPTAKPPSPTNLFTALSLGIVALATSSADPGPTPGDTKGGGGAGGALSILFAIVLFVALPQVGAEGINKVFGLGLDVQSAGFQAITGGAKLLIVVSYMLLIRQFDDIRRVFQYHGAEHKAISTYEAKEELTVANAQAKTTLHARCGTTFLVMVALVSIVVFSAVGSLLPQLPGGRVAQSIGFFFMKLPFLPVIAAITYELQRFFARYCTTGPLRALLWPGFVVQKITTAEPEPAQLEVALASLQAALWRQKAASSAPTEAPDRVFPDYGQLLADPGYATANAR
jgi:uncharacterized protein YqhQ